MTHESILLVLEGTHKHTPAMQRAFDLAHRTGASVHVLLAAHDRVLESAIGLVRADLFLQTRRQFIADRQQWLDTLVAAWNRDGIKASGEALWSPKAHETIVARCLDRSPSLVIKDAGRQTRRSRLLPGALDWKLARYCPAPLMLVCSGSAALPRTVLAAVDTTPSGRHPLDDRIAETAVELAGHLGADVHVAHVFPHARSPYASLDNLYDAVRDEDAKAFKAFAERHGFPSRARHWAAGTPAGELAAIVREVEADLLVLGSAHRSSFDRMFLGSTAAATVSDLPCDVLLMKTVGFATEAYPLHDEAANCEAHKVKEAAAG